MLRCRGRFRKRILHEAALRALMPNFVRGNSGRTVGRFLLQRRNPGRRGRLLHDRVAAWTFLHSVPPTQ
jgi:hypothetical protein